MSNRARIESVRALVEALRRCPRGGGLAVLAPLRSYLFAVAALPPEFLAESWDQEIREQLVQIVGPHLAEATPLTAREAATMIDPAAVLFDFTEELETARETLERSLHGSPLELASLDGLSHANETLQRVCGRLEDPQALLRQTTKAGEPTESLIRLDRARARTQERLTRALCDLHHPVPVSDAEALDLGRWLNGGEAPKLRAGLLELARSLDGWCEQAPLTGKALAELHRQARAADADREESGWGALFQRVILLQDRLLGTEPEVRPLYRSLVSMPGGRRSRAPDSIEEVLFPGPSLKLL